MLKLLRTMRRKERIMAAVCAVFILGQIYFDLSLPDYMSNLTVQMCIRDSCTAALPQRHTPE